MHAEAAGKECSKTDCEHFTKDAGDMDASPVAAKIVKKTSQKPKQAKASKPGKATKKSKLEKPKKWGGRSGGFW